MFQTNLDVKLPGLNTSNINFKIPACLRREHWIVRVTGKWFNYGILFIVMLLDLNMWKNQIFYTPLSYGQYTGEDGHIFSVYDSYSLSHYNNETIYSYAWRNSTIDPTTNQTYITADYRTNSRYRSYSLPLRGIAFIPSVVTLILFGVLIYIFGREGSAQFENKEDPVSLTNVKVIREKDSRDGADYTDSAVKAEGENSEKSSPVGNYGSTEERTKSRADSSITPVG